MVSKTFVDKKKSFSGAKFDGKDPLNCEVNFNHLLLNMIQLTRKLILFECFAPDEKKKGNQPKKILLFGKQKEIPNTNNFSHLVKALVVILQSESAIEAKEKEKEKDQKIILLEKDQASQIKEKEEKKEAMSKALSKNMSKKKKRVSFANIETRGGIILYFFISKC